MALASLRVGLARGVCSQVLEVASIGSTQKCNITSKAYRTKDPSKPKPWPYKQKGLNRVQALYDRASWRFDDNTKVIIVEGNIGIGKTAFAKALAEELEMLHVPNASMDLRFINSYGYDLRQIDSKLSPDNPMRSFDERDFLMNPYDRRTLGFQSFMYRLKYFLMVDALAHLLNTGQGVVMEGSPFSDYLYVDAMAKAGYISPKGREYYYEVKNNTIEELQRPHLVIYLDVPVSTVQEKIKQRKRIHELKSSVLNAEYLTEVEKGFKYSYLKEASKHSELLIYDWSEQGDMEAVVEDVERIDFDKWHTYAHKYDPMLEDWKNKKEFEWSLLRYKYTNTRARSGLDYYFLVPRWDVPEIIVESHEEEEWEKAWFSAPGNKYMKGYNKDMGDGSWLFKTGADAEWLLKTP